MVLQQLAFSPVMSWSYAREKGEKGDKKKGKEKGDKEKGDRFI